MKWYRPGLTKRLRLLLKGAKSFSHGAAITRLMIRQVEECPAIGDSLDVTILMRILDKIEQYDSQQIWYLFTLTSMIEHVVCGTGTLGEDPEILLP